MSIQPHNTSYTEAPTEHTGVDGLFYAYRAVGRPTDVPLICLQHFTGTLDNWDPLVIDGLAQNRRVITIDKSGIGSSDGETPDNVQDMAPAGFKNISCLWINKSDFFRFFFMGVNFQKNY